MSLVQISMEENHFHFMGEHYKQLKGAPMENPISPFIMFIIKLETGLTSGGLMLRFWKRNVNNIYPILRKDHVENTPNFTLRSSIEFTLEMEKERPIYLS